MFMIYLSKSRGKKRNKGIHSIPELLKSRGCTFEWVKSDKAEYPLAIKVTGEFPMGLRAKCIEAGADLVAEEEIETM